MAWDTAWAGAKAAEAMRYLAEHYPESSGVPELHAHQEAAHEAAVAEDRDAFLEALRGYMRAGRLVALQVRKGAA